MGKNIFLFIPIVCVALFFPSCVIKHTESSSPVDVSLYNEPVEDTCRIPGFISLPSHPLKASLLYTYFGISNCTADFNVVGNVISIVDSTYSCSIDTAMPPATDSLESVEVYHFNDANQLVLSHRWGQDYEYKYDCGRLERFSPVAEGDNPCGVFIAYGADSVIVQPCEGGEVLALDDGRPAKFFEYGGDFELEFGFSEREGYICKKLVSCYYHVDGERSYPDSVVALINEYGRVLASVETQFDELGNVIKMPEAQYSYKFDEYDNWVELLCVNADGSAKLIKRRIEYRQ